MPNDYRAYVECDYNSIYHHGVKGMKWGVRRYQNEDGTLTPEGRRRYGKLLDQRRKALEAMNAADEASSRLRKIEKSGVYSGPEWKKAVDDWWNTGHETTRLWLDYDRSRDKLRPVPNTMIFNPNRKYDIEDWNALIDLENDFDKNFGRYRYGKKHGGSRKAKLDSRGRAIR